MDLKFESLQIRNNYATGSDDMSRYGGIHLTRKKDRIGKLFFNNQLAEFG